jgi:hypothetical protein
LQSIFIKLLPDATGLLSLFYQLTNEPLTNSNNKPKEGVTNKPNYNNEMVRLQYQNGALEDLIETVRIKLSINTPESSSSDD